MLKITISAIEKYDDVNNVFISSKEQTLSLEHSLVSLSKWESRWKKSFLGSKEKTQEETIDYIKCMTITQNVDEEVYLGLTIEHYKQISSYIEDEMTATIINQEKNITNREVITSELIYYWMISLNVPFECQKWHLNRLLTLINVCNIKNTPPKKMSRKEILNRNAALNAQRRQAMGTKG